LFINKNKIIYADLIKNHLTPRGLAYWFMDDGGKLDYNKNSKNKEIVLNTQSFEAPPGGKTLLPACGEGGGIKEVKAVNFF